ncbi:hypothetical protein D3C84_1073570 [compost metagenome]
MKAHDLEGAPTGGLQSAGVIDELGVSQTLVFGGTAGISTGTRVDQVGLTGGQIISVSLQRNRVVFRGARAGELAVHDVPLVEDLWLTVVEETRAQALHFVHGHHAGQRNVQAFGGIDQVLVL